MVLLIVGLLPLAIIEAGFAHLLTTVAPKNLTIFALAVCFIGDDSQRS